LSRYFSFQESVKQRRRAVKGGQELDTEEEEGVIALQDRDNLAFTKQMKAKSKKIVMDAEHGRKARTQILG
jgi:hypothetical protein